MKKSSIAIPCWMLLWAITIFSALPSFAQQTNNYQVGDIRTASSGELNQNGGSVLLEQFTASGTWIPSAYPLPTTSTLHILHSVSISSSLTLSNITVAPNQKLTLGTNAVLTTTSSLVVTSNAELLMMGTIDNKGTLQLQSTSKLIVQSPLYHASSTLWSGTEQIDGSSEIRIENAANNALLFDRDLLTQQTNGYYLGKLSIDLSNANTQWNLINNSATFTAGSLSISLPGSSSLQLSAVANANISLGQELTLTGGNYFLQNQANGTSTLTVNGSLTLQGATLTLNKVNSSSATSLIDLKSNLTLDATSSINNSSSVDNSTSGIKFSNNNWQEVNAMGSINHVSLFVKSGALVRLKNNLTLNPNNSVYAGKLTIETGATFDFGSDVNGNGYNVLGQGYFRLEQGGTLYITSAQGINGTGAVGNVQVNETRRTFDQIATYVFSGKVAQQTGNAISTTTSGKIIIIDNPISVSLSQNTGISSASTIYPSGGRLEIRQGQFITGPSADISGDGKLVMTGGVYKIGTLNTIVPQLGGTYTLTGGAIELNGDGNQTLRGLTTYHQVIISSKNQLGVSAKTISNTTTINNLLSIMPDAIFDVNNKTLEGTGGLHMTGGLLRFSKKTTSLPELTGTAAPYNLNGGTIEFYGSASGQYQSIRGTYGTSQKITYNNIELNAVQANLVSERGNIVLSANFDIKGTLNVNAPVALQISSSRAIGGTGNFTLKPGATLLYGSPNGIKNSGTGTSDGNIRISGTRSFSSLANYGFIGASEMVSGNGLPSTVAKLLVAKSTKAVTLTQNVTVTDTITLKSGLIKTGLAELALVNPAPEALKVLNDTLYVHGNLRRGINSNSTYQFPIGDDSGKRWMEITNNNLAGNGFQSLAVSFRPVSNHQNTDMLAVEGNTAYNKLFPEGIWYVIPNATPTAGSYTMRASLKNFQGLQDNNFALLIRPLASTTAKEWNTGGGTLDEFNKEGRTVVGGYSRRNSVTQFGQVGLASAETVLPVTWLYVQATPKQQQVELTWATSTEINNDHFEIEYSPNGKTFTTIGKIAGAGNSAIVRKYQYFHYPATYNTAYYRIKQVDIDGKHEYSKIVTVGPPTIARVSVNLYPNPTHDQISVSGIPIDASTSLEIIDMQGKTVQKASATFTGAETRIPVKHLPAGNYLLHIKQTNTSFKARFIKQ